MAIELDIEDIIGAGCLASIGRAFATLGCLWLGAATGSVSYVLAETASEILAGSPPDAVQTGIRAVILLAWGPLLILASTLLPLFFPLVLLVYFKFARGDGGTVRAWVVYAAITGLLVLLGAAPLEDLGLQGAGLSVALWLGFAGSLAMLAVLLANWQRRHFAEHLVALAVENDERRRQMVEAFGTAAGDREFATGENTVWLPPGEREASHPAVPRPPRGRDGGAGEE